MLHANIGASGYFQWQHKKKSILFRMITAAAAAETQAQPTTFLLLHTRPPVRSIPCSYFYLQLSFFSATATRPRHINATDDHDGNGGR